MGNGNTNFGGVERLFVGNGTETRAQERKTDDVFSLGDR